MTSFESNIPMIDQACSASEKLGVGMYSYLMGMLYFPTPVNYIGSTNLGNITSKIECSLTNQLLYPLCSIATKKKHLHSFLASWVLDPTVDQVVISLGTSEHTLHPSDPIECSYMSSTWDDILPSNEVS